VLGDRRSAKHVNRSIDFAIIQNKGLATALLSSSELYIVFGSSCLTASEAEISSLGLRLSEIDSSDSCIPPSGPSQ